MKNIKNKKKNLEELKHLIVKQLKMYVKYFCISPSKTVKAAIRN